MGDPSMPSKREQELEAILRDLVPATISILWCGLVWNDHNFTHLDLFARAHKAAKALGYERRNGVDAVNAWMERVEKVLDEESPLLMYRIDQRPVGAVSEPSESHYCIDHNEAHDPRSCGVLRPETPSLGKSE